MSWAARLTALALLATLSAAAWWRITAHYDARGYDRAVAEGQAAAAAQATRNRELQRAAELRYTVRDQIRTEYITTTLKEIQHVTTHLAVCPVGPDAVRLLNHAAACASADTAAACGPDKQVPGAP